jgi:hypothetical protein
LKLEADEQRADVWQRVVDRLRSEAKERQKGRKGKQAGARSAKDAQ